MFKKSQKNWQTGCLRAKEIAERLAPSEASIVLKEHLQKTSFLFTGPKRYPKDKL